MQPRCSWRPRYGFGAAGSIVAGVDDVLSLPKSAMTAPDGFFELAMLALDDAQGTADRTRRDALRLDDVTAKPDAESKEPAVTPVVERTRQSPLTMS
jgi:hypothetical protein